VAFEDEVMAVVEKPQGVPSVGPNGWTAERLLSFFLTPAEALGAIHRPRAVRTSIQYDYNTTTNTRRQQYDYNMTTIQYDAQYNSQTKLLCLPCILIPGVVRHLKTSTRRVYTGLFLLSLCGSSH
jgi:hypothetical protein